MTSSELKIIIIILDENVLLSILAHMPIKSIFTF